MYNERYYTYTIKYICIYRGGEYWVFSVYVCIINSFYARVTEDVFKYFSNLVWLLASDWRSLENLKRATAEAIILSLFSNTALHTYTQAVSSWYSDCEEASMRAIKHLTMCIRGIYTESLAIFYARNMREKTSKQTA